MKLIQDSILTLIFSSMTAYCLADGAIASSINTKEIATSKALMNDPQKRTPPQKAPMDIQPATSATPPAMVRFDQCAMPFLTADYLFWTVRQDNMSYAMPAGFSSNLVTDVKNKIQYPDWEWDSGFRVGIGLNLQHDGWDTYLNYTWFYPDSSHDSEKISGRVEAITPTWRASSTTEFVTRTMREASERWRFKFNNLDWELGRNFFISRYLTLRPFAGLKTTWQKQKQRLFTRTFQIP